MDFMKGTKRDLWWMEWKLRFNIIENSEEIEWGINNIKGQLNFFFVVYYVVNVNEKGLLLFLFWYFNV